MINLLFLGRKIGHVLPTIFCCWRQLFDEESCRIHSNISDLMNEVIL